MKRSFLLSVFVLFGVALNGCGGGDGGEAPAGDKKDGDKAAAAEPAESFMDFGPNSTPDQVVTGMIEAMRSGHKEAKEALLTQKAREETARHHMPVADNAMPNAQYQVGKPKYLERNPNGAHVSCVLTESHEDGSTQDYEIVWVLRKDPQIGWRIAGMAVELLPGAPPQFLNFEDPLDMQKKMEEAASALAQQEQQQASIAGAGTDSEATADGSASTDTGNEVASEGESAPLQAVKPSGSKLRKR